MIEKMRTMNFRKTRDQFIKFFLTGLLNTVIDFSILNLLILLFGLGTTNLNYFIFKTTSVLFAVTNSFFWNKKWVFKTKTSGKKMKKEMGSFFLIAFIGMGLNVMVATIVFSTLKNTLPGITDEIHANLGALTGLVIVMIWDFLGYKFVVFKK